MWENRTENVVLYVSFIIAPKFYLFSPNKGQILGYPIKTGFVCVLEIGLRKYFIIMKCIQQQSSKNKFSVKLGSFSILMYHHLQISTDLQRCKGLSKTCQESEECLFNFSSASV